MASASDEMALSVMCSELPLCSCCSTTQAGLTNVLGALYATTLFFSIINATVIQPVISAERAVTYRERAAGMYSTFPWVAAIVSPGHLLLSYLACRRLVPLGTGL